MSISGNARRQGGQNRAPVEPLVALCAPLLAIRVRAYSLTATVPHNVRLRESP